MAMLPITGRDFRPLPGPSAPKPILRPKISEEAPSAPSHGQDLCQLTLPLSLPALAEKRPAASAVTAAPVAARASSAPTTMLMEAPTLDGVGAAKASSVPQSFTQKEVDSYYMTTGADGKVGLSDAGKAVFATVKAKFMDPVPKAPFGSPTLYFSGGLPGSGKSATMRELFKGSKDEFVRVDPDAIKETLLEDLATKNPALRPQMAADDSWAGVVHETSSLMAKQLANESLGTGKDVLYDSTMASATPDKFQNLAAKARAVGYRVQALITKVTPETAARRALERAKYPTVLNLPDQTTLKLPGRLIQKDYIDECQSHLENNLHHFVQTGLFDRMTVFNNDKDGMPAQREATYKRQMTEQGPTCEVVGGSA